jgi:hypothetical protein
MSERNNIKWRKRDEKELDRLVHNFNAKIARTLKSHPELAGALPEKITKHDLKEKIETRTDYKREVKSYTRFLKRGAEQVIESKSGIVTTKWQKQELGYKVAQINRQRTIERKAAEQMDARSRGVSLGLKRGEMGNVRTNELRPKKFNFDKIKPGREWESFIESVEKQAMSSYTTEKMERYKDNYLKALKNTFVNGQADDLIKLIESLDAKTVVDTYYSDEQASIDFPYDPIDANFKLDILVDLWQSIAESASESE